MDWVELAFVGYCEVVKKLIEDYPYLEYECDVLTSDGVEVCEAPVEIEVRLRGSETQVAKLLYNSVLELPPTSKLFKEKLLDLSGEVLYYCSLHDIKVARIYAKWYPEFTKMLNKLATLHNCHLNTNPGKVFGTIHIISLRMTVQVGDDLDELESKIGSTIANWKLAQELKEVILREPGKRTLSFDLDEALRVLRDLDKIAEFVRKHGRQDALDELKERLMIDPHEGLFSLEGT